jgi:hypothetical protein
MTRVLVLELNHMPDRRSIDGKHLFAIEPKIGIESFLVISAYRTGSKTERFAGEIEVLA